MSGTSIFTAPIPCLRWQVISPPRTAMSGGFDRDHAGNGLDRARDLRRHLEAAGQLHLDLGARVEQERQADFAVALGLEPPRDAFERRLRAHEDAQALRDLLCGRVELL